MLRLGTVQKSGPLLASASAERLFTVLLQRGTVRDQGCLAERLLVSAAGSVHGLLKLAGTPVRWASHCAGSLPGSLGLLGEDQLPRKLRTPLPTVFAPV